VAVLDICALGIYGFLFYQVKAKTENISVLTSQLETVQKQESEYRKIEDTIKGLQDRSNELDTYIVQEKNLLDFIKIIESIAKKQSVVIKTEIKKNEPTKGETNIKFDFTITVDGKWDNIQNMLALVENLPYNILVSNFTVRENDAEEGTPSWSGAIKFSIVAQK